MARTGYCAWCGGEYAYQRRTKTGTCSDGCRQDFYRAKRDEAAGRTPKTPTPFAEVFLTKVLLLGGGVSHIAKLTAQSRWKVFARSAEGGRARAALERERDRLTDLIELFPEPEPSVEVEPYEPTAEEQARAMRWWDERMVSREKQETPTVTGVGPSQ